MLNSKSQHMFLCEKVLMLLKGTLFPTLKCSWVQNFRKLTTLEAFCLPFDRFWTPPGRQALFKTLGRQKVD